MENLKNVFTSQNSRLSNPPISRILALNSVAGQLSALSCATEVGMQGTVGTLIFSIKISKCVLLDSAYVLYDQIVHNYGTGWQ